ncbi:alpha/beta fold hydrolase [Amaricoccus macauensis]|uniref:alpha/beta fold hydrolase n=1 Tax=Amaricoccus macauensis TaxID=57001 RepID=UPI003C7B025E
MTRSHRFCLPGGRWLAWHEWGTPEGRAVIVCPGAGMAGPMPFGEREAERESLRLISVDRPGLGGSEPDSGKSFTSFARDVRALLDHLGLDAVAAIGFSQGAPFALALAAEGVVPAVSLVSGQDELAHPDVLTQLPPPVADFVRRAAGDGPALEEEITATATADWLWQMIETMSSPQDRAFYASETFAQLYRASLAAGFRQGAAGYARDTILALAPWPFRLEDLDCPVRLWFGREDASPVHSPDLGATLAARLPDANLNRIDGAGSAILWTHADAILREIARGI